jgi:DNA-binding CsgD family transcriptional regulator
MEVNMILKDLSRQATYSLLELINDSVYCCDEIRMRKLVNNLRQLIPFDYSICCQAKLDSNKRIMDYEVINIDYPSEWLDLYIRSKFHMVDPIVKENFSNFGVQSWVDTYIKHNPPKLFLSRAEDFGLKSGYTVGMRSLREAQGSLFSIAGKSVERHARTATILECFAPHFHQALTRITYQHADKALPVLLSSREIEVLNWMKNGKCSWDISVILSISERTVNFHANNIRHKLNAVSRSQAVAIALHHGIIDME